MGTKKLTVGLLIVYLVFLSWIIVFKMQLSFASLPDIRNINLIPFDQSVIVNNVIDYDEILSNVLAFIPFGIFISMLDNTKTLVKRLMPIFLVSLLFEILQYIFAIGASDITDLITNTMGGIVGIGIYDLLATVFKKHVNLIVNVICLIGAILLMSLMAILIYVNL